MARFYSWFVGTVHMIRTTRDPNSLPLIAVVAHEAKHDELRALCRAQRRSIARVRFVADARTASALAREVSAPVMFATSGAHPGLMKIGLSIASGAVEAAIVLRAPVREATDPDIDFLIRLCDRSSVPVATNDATATILLEILAKSAGSTGPPAERWSRNRHPSVFSGRRFPWYTTAGHPRPPRATTGWFGATRDV